jgi:carbon monoxide dehydrogenase subunit G
MSSTRVARHVNAPRPAVYRALLDSQAVARWITVVEFETADPARRGEMRITIGLTDADGGTDVLAVHDNLPRGLSAADDEAGWRSSLAKLAVLVEADEP